MCEVAEVSDGSWRMVSGGGGRTGTGPKSSSPRVNLGGSGDSNPPFQAGGFVEHKGHTVTKVHLVSAHNVVLEDIVEDDIVLFLDDSFIEFPMQALLYDAQGTLVGQHPVLPG